VCAHTSGAVIKRGKQMMLSPKISQPLKRKITKNKNENSLFRDEEISSNELDELR
jgi:hypothetical protein